MQPVGQLGQHVTQGKPQQMELTAHLVLPIVSVHQEYHRLDVLLDIHQLPVWEHALILLQVLLLLLLEQLQQMLLQVSGLWLAR